MKLKMLVSLSGNEYSLSPNDEHDFPDAEAERLIAAGFAVAVSNEPVEPVEPVEPTEPVVVEQVEAAATEPTEPVVEPSVEPAADTVVEPPAADPKPARKKKSS